MAAWKSTLVAIMCLISCSVDGATPQNADAVVPEALVQQSHGAKPIVVPLTDSGNMEYYGAVEIGTPPKKFVLNFDTGSDWLWVPSGECMTTACDKHTTWQTDKSHSAQPTATTAATQFATGAMRGVAFFDSVSFPGIGGNTLKASGITVVAAQQVDGAIFTYAPYDGVVGLNRKENQISSGKSKKTSTNFLRAAHAQGAIPKAMVSMFLGSTGVGTGGVAVLGGIDHRFIDQSKKLQWIPVLKNTDGAWAVKIKSLRVGKDGKKNFCGSKGCVGIIDSGTWGIVGKDEIIKPMLDAAELYMPDFPCDFETPQLRFDFGTGEELELSLTHTASVEHKKHKICSPAAKAADLPISFKGLEGMPVMLLGDPFLRTFYTVLDNTDADKPRVGLALGNTVALSEIEN